MGASSLLCPSCPAHGSGPPSHLRASPFTSGLEHVMILVPIRGLPRNHFGFSPNCLSESHGPWIRFLGLLYQISTDGEASNSRNWFLLSRRLEAKESAEPCPLRGLQGSVLPPLGEVLGGSTQSLPPTLTSRSPLSQGHALMLGSRARLPWVIAPGDGSPPSTLGSAVSLGCNFRGPQPTEAPETLSGKFRKELVRFKSPAILRSGMKSREAWAVAQPCRPRVLAAAAPCACARVPVTRSGLWR